MDDFTIVIKSLRARMFSTITTSATVAVAVALLLVLLGLRDSGRQAFNRGAGNMHLLISASGSELESVLDGIFYANAPNNFIPWAKYEQISQSQPWAYAIPVQMGDSYRGLPVIASTREFFDIYEPSLGQPWTLAEGRFFEDTWELVVGAQAARTTGLQIGDILALTHGTGSSDAAHVHKEFEFTVVGIAEVTGSPHDRALMSTLEGSWVLHAHDRRLSEDPTAGITTVDDIEEHDKLITGIYARVFTRPGRNSSAALQSVHYQLRLDPQITAVSPSAQITKLLGIVSNIDQIFLAMAGAVLLSSGIAIMLALYNSMEQRRRQIAVLRVLGCSKGRVFSMVMTESAMLGLAGSVAGVAIAFVGAQFVAGIMKSRLGLVIEPGLGIEWVLFTIVATVLLASLAGVVPSMMAYRTSVSRALRPLG